MTISIFLLLILTVSIRAVTYPCPQMNTGTISQRYNPSNGVCYRIYRQSIYDFYEAIPLCEDAWPDEDSHLLSLHSQDEFDFLRDDMPGGDLPSNTWHGLVKREATKEWQYYDFYWLDGSPVDFLAPSNIDGGEVNEFCVCMRMNGNRFLDRRCFINYAAGCAFQLKSCFGIWAQNPTSCNGDGLCSSEDYCECDTLCGVECNQPANYFCDGIHCRNFDQTCSGHGRCQGPDTCSCYAQWEGPTCNIPKRCGAYAANDSRVCDGNGDCVDTDICTCHEGYYALNGFCDKKVSCFGYAFDDPRVCSGIGKCDEINNCQCGEGVWYYDCRNCFTCEGRGGTQHCLYEDDSCYGKNNVCTSGGSACTQNNFYCICSAGYSGTNCVNWDCHGTSRHDNDVCSGNGTCWEPDNCVCPGYWGDECSKWYCFDKLHDETDVCSGNGTCNSPNECICPNYEGEDCSLWRCHGKLMNDSTQVCSGVAECVSPDFCDCLPGYGGLECGDWECFGTPRIENDTVCSSNGTCVGIDDCYCPGYVGNECQIWTCGGIYANDSRVCSGNGTCVNPDECICPDYIGANCETWGCNGKYANSTDVCAGNGQCTEPGVCQCGDYDLPNCETWRCHGTLSTEESSVCSSNGTCVAPDNCDCGGEYFGSQCEIWKCGDAFANETFEVCSNNGTCVSPNTCFCPDYVFPDCSSWLCGEFTANDTLHVCSGNGDCVSPGLCLCPGYDGDVCQNWYCGEFLNTENETVCSGRGTCLSPGLCECEIGYQNDPFCRRWTCDGVNNNETDIVCGGGHGICVGIDTCECFPNQWSGDNCTIPICWGVISELPEACTENGVCVGPDDCTCTDLNYLKPYCNTTTCNEVLSTAQNEVCNGHGECVEYNDCDCQLGSVGEYCDDFYTPPIVDVRYAEMVGLCSDIILNADHSYGYQLSFFWQSPSYVFPDGGESTQIVAMELPGYIDFQVYVIDFWGRVSKTVNLTVVKVPYTLPVAIIDSTGDDVYTFANNINFEIEGHGESDCGGDGGGNYIYKWQQIDILSVDRTIDFTSIDTTAQKITLKNGFPLAEWSYVLQFSVITALGSATATINIHVSVRSVVAVISDSSRNVPIGETVYLDGTDSYDPEESSFPNEYLWDCSNPSGGSCAGLQPNGVGYATFYAMQDGDYVVSLTYRKGDRSAVTSVTYSVFTPADPDDYIPSISVKYVPSKLGSPYVVANERVILEGRIGDHPNSVDVEFLWSCGAEIDDLAANILSDSLDGLNLVIKPDVITVDTTCVLTATYKLNQVSAFVVLKINTPPVAGVVDVDPLDGVAVIDTFVMRFADFSDVDEPLSYAVSYIDIVTETEIICVEFTPNNEVSFNVLTPGCASLDYELEIRVKVRDCYDAETVVVVPLKIEPLDEFDVYSDLVKDTIDYLEDAIRDYDDDDDDDDDDFGGDGIVDDGLDMIVMVYSLVRGGSCGELTAQQLECISRSQCEGFDILKQMPDEFRTFQMLTVSFLNVYFDAFVQGKHSDVIVDVLESVIYDNQRELYEGTLAFIKSFLPEFSEFVGIGKFQVFLDIIEQVILIASEDEGSSSRGIGVTMEVFENEIYAFVMVFVRSFLRKLMPGEKNTYLTSSQVLQFEFIKDYAPKYEKMNDDLELTLKEMEIANKTKVVVSRDVVMELDPGDVMNSVLLHIPSFHNSSGLVFIAFYYGASEQLILDLDLGEPLEIFPLDVHIGSLKDLECFVVKNFSGNGVANDVVPCTRKITGGNTYSCQCSKIQSLFYGYRVVDEPKEAGNPVMMALPYILTGVLTALVVVCLVFTVMFVVIMVIVVNVRSKKKKVAPNEDVGKKKKKQTSGEKGKKKKKRRKKKKKGAKKKKKRKKKSQKREEKSKDHVVSVNTVVGEAENGDFPVDYYNPHSDENEEEDYDVEYEEEDIDEMNMKMNEEKKKREVEEEGKEAKLKSLLERLKRRKAEQEEEQELEDLN